ncbi:MAG: hypothetical protein AVO35_11215 [Candidatus Aegiribacteria sp. MLS_C]|nr:MAG: hypothetical protein AVO35_11215 [Candidatus Aegiribacteria sp. MLS_C]
MRDMGTLLEQLTSTFDGVRARLDDDGRMRLEAEKESVMSLLSFLRDSGFDFLQMVSCVDWIDRGSMELVYVLSSYPSTDGGSGDLLYCILKVELPRDRARTVSVIPLYECAEPYEREIHELFGVDFHGHPRLTPLLLEREYPVPPFRKDFDTRKYVSDFFDSIPPVEEEGGAQ